MPHDHSIERDEDTWPVAWTHTHYGRGTAPPGAGAIGRRRAGRFCLFAAFVAGFARRWNKT